jgi:hypothetical protein
MDDLERAEDRCLGGMNRIAVHQLMKAAGGQEEADGLVDCEQGLRQPHQADEPVLLLLESPEVEDPVRQALVEVVVLPARHSEDIVAIPAQALDDPLPHSQTVKKDQPAPGLRHGPFERRLPPGGHPEPVLHVRCRLDLRRAFGRIDPVALTFEGVSRERHPLPALVVVEAGPIDLDASDPQPAHGFQEGFEVGALAQSGDGDPVGPGGRMLLDQRSERGARADLQEDAVGLAEQLADAFSEADGAPHVARPVAGVGEVVRGDPGAGDVGNERDARRLHPDLARDLREGSHGWLHHGGVEGVRGLQPDAAHPELSLQRVQCVRGAAHHAEMGPIRGR